MKASRVVWLGVNLLEEPLRIWTSKTWAWAACETTCGQILYSKIEYGPVFVLILVPNPSPNLGEPWRTEVQSKHDVNSKFVLVQ